MVAATFTKIEDWVEYMVEGANVGSDAFRLVLSNTEPVSGESPSPITSGNGLLTNVTQIAYTNISTPTFTTSTGTPITTSSSAEASGTHTLDFADITITAGGTVADFQYIYVYDDTVAGDPLVALFDYGSTISMTSGETLAINFNASGFFTVE